MQKTTRIDRAPPSKHNRRYAIFGTILEGPPHAATQPQKWNNGPNVVALQSVLQPGMHRFRSVSNLCPPSSFNRSPQTTTCVRVMRTMHWHVALLRRFAKRDKRDQRALKRIEQKHGDVESGKTRGEHYYLRRQHMRFPRSTQQNAPAAVLFCLQYVSIPIISYI